VKSEAKASLKLVLELPEKLLAKLKELSEKEGSPLEGFVAEILCRQVEPLDPELKAELHEALSAKLLHEAKELLAKGDHVQASEKAWGAAAQAVKALAARRGVELRSHGELWSYVSRLREETGDEDLSRLWHVANSLHVNFYEAWATRELVEDAVNDIERLVEKLRRLA